MPKLDASFKSLADSTRREILYLLAVTPSGIPMNEISSHFSLSRQGTAKHIKTLKNAGLVEIKLEGRERKCYLNPLPLQSVMDWLEFYKPYWKEKISLLNSSAQSD